MAQPAASRKKTNDDYGRGRLTVISSRRPAVNRMPKRRRIRIHRRGRVVLGMFLAGMLLLGIPQVMIFGAVQRNEASSVETIVVQRGDNLWNLATERTPAGKDVRIIVHEIQRLNGLEQLTAGSLQPGMVLRVPLN